MLANDIRNYQISDYIAHHGILGQKWGKKNGPPYPLAAGSHSSSEKKAASAAGVKVGKSSGRGSSEGLNITQSGQKEKPGLIGSMIEGANNAKLNKQRKAALEKARQAKAAKAEYEAEKKKALESGDYKQIQKYANELSTKELQDALMRADTLDRLNKSVDARTPKQKDVWDTIDDVAKKVGTATNAFNKGKDAWNTFANAWNTFADDSSMLPELGTNFAEQKEKKRNEVAEASRKAQVDMLSKSLDPKKIMDNQDIFTKNELSDALGRIATYNSLKEEQNNRNTADEKAIKEAEARAKEQLEKNRKDKIADLTKKGDISEILKNKDLFTNDELQSASARYEILKNIERKINDASPKDLERKINDVSPKDLEDIYEYLDDWND